MMPDGQSPREESQSVKIKGNKQSLTEELSMLNQKTSVVDMIRLSQQIQ